MFTINVLVVVPDVSTAIYILRSLAPPTATPSLLVFFTEGKSIVLLSGKVFYVDSLGTGAFATVLSLEGQEQPM